MTSLTKDEFDSSQLPLESTRQPMPILYRLHTTVSGSITDTFHEQHEDRRFLYLLDRIPSDPDDSHDYMIPETPIDVEVTSSSYKRFTDSLSEDEGTRQPHTNPLRNRRSLPRIISAPELRTLAERFGEDEDVPPVPEMNVRDYEDWYGTPNNDAQSSHVAAATAASVDRSRPTARSEEGRLRKRRRTLSRKFSASVQNLRAKNSALLIREQQENPEPPVPISRRTPITSSTKHRRSRAGSLFAHVRFHHHGYFHSQESRNTKPLPPPFLHGKAKPPARSDSDKTSQSHSSKSSTATTFILQTRRRILQSPKLSFTTKAKHAARETLHEIKRLPATGVDAITSAVRYTGSRAGEVVCDATASTRGIVRKSVLKVTSKYDGELKSANIDEPGTVPPFASSPTVSSSLTSFPSISSRLAGRPKRSKSSPLYDIIEADVPPPQDSALREESGSITILSPRPPLEVDVFESPIIARIITPAPTPSQSKTRRKHVRRSLPKVSGDDPEFPSHASLDPVVEEEEEEEEEEKGETTQPSVLPPTNMKLPNLLPSDSMLTPALLGEVNIQAQDMAVPMIFVTNADNDVGSSVDIAQTRGHLYLPTSEMDRAQLEFNRQYLVKIEDAQAHAAALEVQSTGPDDQAKEQERGGTCPPSSHLLVDHDETPPGGENGQDLDQDEKGGSGETVIATQRKHWYSGRLPLNPSEPEDEQKLACATSEGVTKVERQVGNVGTTDQRLEARSVDMPSLSDPTDATTIASTCTEKTPTEHEVMHRKVTKARPKRQVKHGKTYVTLMLVGSLLI